MFPARVVKGNWQNPKGPAVPPQVYIKVDALWGEATTPFKGSPELVPELESFLGSIDSETLLPASSASCQASEPELGIIKSPVVPGS